MPDEPDTLEQKCSHPGGAAALRSRAKRLRKNRFIHDIVRFIFFPTITLYRNSVVDENKITKSNNHRGFIVPLYIRSTAPITVI